MNDLKALAKYPEFYVLKQKLIQFCQEMDDLSEIDVNSSSRVSLETEVIGRRIASDRVKAFLVDLGMLSQEDIIKKDKTYE